MAMNIVTRVCWISICISAGKNTIAASRKTMNNDVNKYDERGRALRAKEKKERIHNATIIDILTR